MGRLPRCKEQPTPPFRPPPPRTSRAVASTASAVCCPLINPCSFQYAKPSSKKSSESPFRARKSKIAYKIVLMTQVKKRHKNALEWTNSQQLLTQQTATTPSSWVAPRRRGDKHKPTSGTSTYSIPVVNSKRDTISLLNQNQLSNGQNIEKF